jgi:DNA-binding transcriptional LysR family regulator
VRLHPHSKISLKVANTEQIIEKLLKFDIDVGMIEGNCYSDEIEVFPWKKDELIIIASTQNPLARKKKITLQDLHQAKWILREPGSGTREKFEEAMTGKINAYLEFGHTEAVKQAVQADLGISCLSRTAVAELLKNGQLRELKTPFLKLTRDFYILLHKDKHKTALLSQFLGECNKHIS